jgi:aldehyde:ferredoxin oxidoreductase
MAAFDCAGMCFMASVALLGPEGNEAFRQVMSAKFGAPFEPDDFPYAMGARVLKAEHEFNRKAGFTNQDDRLPRFFYEEPLPPHNTVFSISDEALDRTFDF